MERVKLWREARQTLVGTVELDEENRRLFFHIDDEREKDRVAAVFKGTGEVSWGWTGSEGGEWQEHKAEPLTGQWFWHVVTDRLYPLGYQPDFEAS